MRSKHIAALITFFATFAFSAFIALLFAAPKVYDVPPVVNSYELKVKRHTRCSTGSKIKDFLEQDKRNGYDRRNADYSDDVSRLSRRAEANTRYYAKSASMNAFDLPDDFQNAWFEHMKAWRDYSRFLENEGSKKAVSEDFEQRENDYVSDINLSWQEVLSIGREHGADLPGNF